MKLDSIFFGHLTLAYILFNILYKGTFLQRYTHLKGFPGGSDVQNLPAMEETWVQSLGQKDILEKRMATHSSILSLENSMDKGAWWE